MGGAHPRRVPRARPRGRSSSPSPRRCAGSASRRSCCSTSSPPSARTPRRPATRAGTSSSTTAGARPTPWAGSSSSSSSRRTPPCPRSPTRSAPASSSRTTGRTRRRLRPGPDLRARGPHAPPRGRHLGLQHRPGERRLARADGRADRPDPRASSSAGGPLCDRVGRELRFEMRLTWLGGNVDPRPHRGDRGRRLPAAAEARAARQGRARLAGLAVALGMSASVGARLTRQSGTNFYYAFRILPEEKRRAIYALYAFCRVVDDCVDEEGGEGEAGLRRWLAEVHRAYAGRPETELGRELAETVARFPIPRGALRGRRGGLPHGPHHAPLRHLRRPARLLRARGLGGGPRLDRDLRLRRPAHARVRGRAGPRAPAHEHPARRGGGRRPRTASTSRSRTSPASACRRRSCSPPRADPRAPRAAGLDRLLAFEADRARSHYAAAAARAAGARPPVDARRARSWAPIYREVLEEWARRGHPVGGARVQLGKPRKIWHRAADDPAGALGPCEGRRRRGRLRGLRRGHRAAGAAARGRAARAARRPRRAGHLVARRGHRRGRGQRHPPDDRRLRRDPRPRPAGGGLGPRPRPGQPQARVGGRRRA